MKALHLTPSGDKFAALEDSAANLAQLGAESQDPDASVLYQDKGIKLQFASGIILNGTRSLSFEASGAQS